MGKVRTLRIQQPQSVTRMVVDRLRGAIVEGHYTLGENISEEKLAETFGVSCTPIREALSILQQSGLVIVRPKRGSFVFSPSLKDVADLCEYRLMLELQAARFAVDRDRTGLLTALRGEFERMATAIEVGDSRAYASADTAFHNAFFGHCGNRLVADAFSLADARLATLRTVLTIPYQKRRDTSFEEHGRIVELVEAGDLAGLHDVLDEHIVSTIRVAADAFPSTADDAKV